MSDGNKNRDDGEQPSVRDWAEAASKSPDDFPEKEGREAEATERAEGAPKSERGETATTSRSAKKNPDGGKAPDTTIGKGDG